MEERDIIKANDLCSKTPQQCKDCPFCKFDDCVSELAEKTIDLINRQKAEIEMWKSSAELWEGDAKALFISRENIKAEAIKEFAERLKVIGARNNEGHILFVEKNFDNLVKEMGGEG